MVQINGVGHIKEIDIPVREHVQGACEILGFDPLYVANKGQFVTFFIRRACKAGIGHNSKRSTWKSGQNYWPRQKIPVKNCQIENKNRNRSNSRYAEWRTVAENM